MRCGIVRCSIVRCGIARIRERMRRKGKRRKKMERRDSLQSNISGLKDLEETLKNIEKSGGEGLMLRKPHSEYVAGRRY